MDLLKKINIFRREITKQLTSNLGKKKKKYYTTNTNIKKILVSRPNHRLGNQILITPLIQELENLFPESKIDLFVKGEVSHDIFKNYQIIDKIITLPKEHFKNLFSYFKAWLIIKTHKYDLGINIAFNSSSGRISIKISNSSLKIYGDEIDSTPPNNEDFDHIAKRPIYNLRTELNRIGFTIDRNEIPSVSLKLNKQEIAEGKNKLDKIFNNNYNIISIFTYATGDKIYEEEWWNSFYNELEKNFPNYNFIEILPVEKVSQLNFKIPSFYSKEIREIAGVIANTSVFVGADSGMMHLATSTGTPTLGLFSVTNPRTYEPYGKMNKGINTNVVSNLEIIEMVKTILNSNL